MSKQTFTAAEREALWLAHRKKCAYTRELIDVSDFHIDHIVPEHLADQPNEFAKVKLELGLDESFDINGYGNLVPCKQGPNLQKGSTTFGKPQTLFFLGIAASKVQEIEDHLARLETRKLRGRAIVLLQQCLERGELTPVEVAKILEDYSNEPEQIFGLIQSMQFADSEEIKFIAKTDIDALRDRPVLPLENDIPLSVRLGNGAGDFRDVTTCREYDAAVAQGFHPQNTYNLKISSQFVHRCGLLNCLQAAATPKQSYVAEPRVSVLNMELMPFSLFPYIGDSWDERLKDLSTYQNKVDEGALVVKRLRQNLLRIEETEGMGQELIEVARADFTGNGFEEILLFEYMWATHGTFGAGHIQIITRKSPTGLFQSVKKI